MRQLKQRIISAVAALSLLVSVIPAVPVQADSLSISVNEPFHSGVTFTLPDGTSATSNSYRIPAMVTLSNGTIVAASDIRWNTTYDGGGLDTLTARSSDGGVSWNYTVANYLGDNSNQHNSLSTSFIDPCLVANGNTVYMLVDLYPYGVALNGGTVSPEQTTGFDGGSKLLLSDDEHKSYGYYLNLNDYIIYDTAGNSTGIEVDPYFNYTLPAATFGLKKSTQSTEPTEETTEPTEETTAPTEETTAPTEETTAPTEETTAPTEEPTAPAEETTAPTEEPTAPTEETTAPTEEPTAPTEETTAPTEETTAPTEETTAPTEETTVPTEEGDLSLRGGFWSGLVIKASAAEYDPDEDVAPAAAETHNLFFGDSPYKVARTGYLYLTKSTNGGVTWSEPKLLNLKNSSEQVCLVGPGRGITTSQGLMVIPIYSYNGGTQKMGFVYSSNGSDWYRVNSTFSTMWSSESAVVETSNGNLRFFFRNGSAQLYYVDYSFNGGGWTNPVSTGIATNSNTQISAITYSKELDGKQVILVSCPAGPAGGSSESGAQYRTNGRIFVFTDDGGSMTRINTIEVNSGNFMYSCLTERSDGSVAILYEDTETGWGTGYKYEMEMKAYTASELGITSAPEAPGGEEPEETETINISLHVSQTSEQMSVSDTEQIGNPGTYTTPNGIASYTIVHEAGSTGETTREQLDSLVANQTIVIHSNGNYLKINGSTLEATTDLEQATKWTVGISGSGFTLKNENTYFGYYKNAYDTCSLNVSPTPSIWNYSAEKGFHFLPSSDTWYLYYSSSWLGPGWKCTSSSSTASQYPSYAYSVMVAGGSGGSTNVTFTGLKPGSDSVTLGDSTYIITVSALEETLLKNMTASSVMRLDAMADLGLTGDYTVSYALTSGTAVNVDTSGTVTSGPNTGSAVITATVTKDGTICGTVTYEVTVSAILVNDTQNIYLPIDGKAIISGLSGEIYTALLDTGIATVTRDGSVTINGKKTGDTAVIIGTTLINIHVVPKNTDPDREKTKKHIYVNIDAIENCKVYYSINGSALYPLEGTGLLMDQDYYGGFNIAFYAAPQLGYALTEMTSTNSNGDYYTLTYTGDISNSPAWPLNADGLTYKASPSGFQWPLKEGNVTPARLKEVFDESIALGCHGALTFAKNSEGNNLDSSLTFRAEKLPELSKEIIGYKRFGEPSDADIANGKLNVSGYTDYFAFDNDVTLEFGDTLLYRFTVTSTSTNVEYTDITLRDDKIGFVKNIADNAYKTPGNYRYYATYEITPNDIGMYTGGKFVNNAQLSYQYHAAYSTGVYGGNASSEATCDIVGVVSYAWEDGTPEAIVRNDGNRYSLPESFSLVVGDTFNISQYEGATTYTETVDGHDVIWTYSGEWGAQHYGSSEKTWFLVETALNRNFTMEHSRSITFYGRWLANYSVVYKWVGDSPDIPVPAIVSYQVGDKYTVDNTFSVGHTYNDGTYLWTFQGWKDSSGTVCNGQEKTISSSHVYYNGTWTKVASASSLTIQKTGCSTTDENQSFMFHLSGDGVALDVVIHGNGSVTVSGLTVGKTYTVTEDTKWSWRYQPGNASQTVQISSTGNTITFNNTRSTGFWLSGGAWCDNRFNGNP